MDPPKVDRANPWYKTENEKCFNIYIYIYVKNYKQRERERLHVYVCIYIYIYTPNVFMCM